MTTPGHRRRVQLNKKLDALVTTPWLLGKTKPAKPRPVAKTTPVTKLSVMQSTPNNYQRLLARDGNCCWLCHEPLGMDMTIEHLVATAHGGPSHLSNYVLCHALCNNLLDSKPVAEKVRMREQRNEK